MKGETELEMVKHHARKGEGHLGRQAAKITELQERRAPSGMAITLLEQFKDMQCQHRADLIRLEAECIS